MKINFLYSEIIDNELWFVEQNNKILARLQPDEKVVRPVCFLNNCGNGDYSFIKAYHNDIYLFPSSCKQVLKYNLSTKKLEEIYECDEIFRCASIIESNDKIIAFSAGFVEPPISINVTTGEISRIDFDIRGYGFSTNGDFSTLSVLNNMGYLEYSVYGTNIILKSSIFQLDFEKKDIDKNIKIKRIFLCGNKRLIIDIKGKLYIENDNYSFDLFDVDTEFTDAIRTENGLLFIPISGGNFLEYNENNTVSEISLNIENRIKNRFGIVKDNILYLSPYYHNEIMAINLNNGECNKINPQIDTIQFRDIRAPKLVSEGMYDLRSFIDNVLEK